MSKSSSGFFDQRQGLKNSLQLDEKQLSFAVLGSSSQAEMLQMDSNYETPSHSQPPPPMDGRDQLTQLPQMDFNRERPSQAEPPCPVDGGNWRTQLLPDSRQKIVNKILVTLQRHLPVSGEEGLQELRKIAIRFEEKIYSAATSQSDYLRKISLKMLTMESKSQTLESRATSAPGSGSTRQQEIERIAENIEQNMRAAIVNQPDYMKKMSVLKDAFDEFEFQSTVQNALPSNSTDVIGGLPNLAEFLPVDSNYETPSPAQPPPPMNGGDQLTQLLQIDFNHERPFQAEPPPPMEGENWRTQLLPDSRQKIVNKILNTLSRHLSCSNEEELRKTAVCFEEEIYSAATSQSDYLRKISLKMVTVESKSQTSGSRSRSILCNPLPSNSTDVIGDLP